MTPLERDCIERAVLRRQNIPPEDASLLLAEIRRLEKALSTTERRWREK